MYSPYLNKFFSSTGKRTAIKDYHRGIWLFFNPRVGPGLTTVCYMKKGGDSKKNSLINSSKFKMALYILICAYLGKKKE